MYVFLFSAHRKLYIHDVFLHEYIYDIFLHGETRDSLNYMYDIFSRVALPWMVPGINVVVQYDDRRPVLQKTETFK